MSDPRNNADDAFEAFMSMGESEWLGLVGSLMRGGVLTVAEQAGFDRAVAKRKERQAHPPLQDPDGGRRGD